jgi:hypothetical protein
VKRRRSTARILFAVMMATLLGLVLVLFPIRARHAAAQAANGAAPPAKGPKRSDGMAAAPASVAIAPPATAPPSTPRPVPPSDDEAKAIPQGKGLPLLVSAAVFFLEVTSFDDTKGEFDATVDLRLSWSDLRHRYPAHEAFRGYKEFRGKAAEEQIAKMWTPEVDVTNRLESPSHVARRLRIFPDGRIETISRTTARYKVKVDPERFPFDRQFLAVDLLVREQTTDEVVLTIGESDVDFSRIAPDATIDGWQPGLVNLERRIVPGWNGDRYSGVTASLRVSRQASSSLAPIFIPLFASLLIPLLAIWMNRATEEGFEVEAFELANMGIGGLFSVIALSFAIYSSYGVIAGGDNTVTRLFGLNYASLAISLLVVILLFQFNVVHRLFGRYVHMEVFRFLTWALPVASLATSLAFLLAAAA